MIVGRRADPPPVASRAAPPAPLRLGAGGNEDRSGPCADNEKVDTIADSGYPRVGDPT